MKRGLQCHIVTGELNFSGTLASGVLKVLLENKFSKIHMGEGDVVNGFICVELHSLGYKVPCPITQSYKSCSWEISKSKSKAGIQVLQLGPVHSVQIQSINHEWVQGIAVPTTGDP